MAGIENWSAPHLADEDMTSLSTRTAGGAIHRRAPLKGHAQSVITGDLVVNPTPDGQSVASACT